MALLLTIDDSSMTRNGVRQVLKEAGHEILEADDGDKGLELVTSKRPDCIILDLIMQRIGGIEVLKSLRDMNSKIPVIVLSADIQEIVRKECFELGAKAFISKPMIRQELNKTIQEVLSQEKECVNESVA